MLILCPRPNDNNCFLFIMSPSLDQNDKFLWWLTWIAAVSRRVMKFYIISKALTYWQTLPTMRYARDIWQICTLPTDRTDWVSSPIGRAGVLWPIDRHAESETERPAEHDTTILFNSARQAGRQSVPHLTTAHSFIHSQTYNRELVLIDVNNLYTV